MEKFEAFKRLLAHPAFIPDTLELRESVCLAANQAFVELGAASPAERAEAAAALQAFAADDQLAANAFLRTLACSLLYGATGDAAHLTAAIAVALAEPVTDVGVGMNTVYTITRLAFLDQIGAAQFDYEARHRYWSGLVDLAETVAPPRKAAFTPNDRLLILTDQFIQPPHAPSRDALDFGRMFQDAGRQVMIASTCAFGRQLYSAILPGSVCVVNEAMGGIDRFEFEGRVFRYHQPASGQFNTQTLNETLRAIEAFDPAMVLAIGVQNLTAELLDAGRFVVQYPTIAGLPTTRNNHFFMWREPTAEEAELIEQLGLGKNFLFSHHPGFAPPPRTTTLSRAPFAIPEDAFVFAVVRMRLDDDIDDAFLALMRDVRARAPNAHFVFIGEFDGFFQRVGADPSVAGYATHVGFQSDIMAAYELCDAYINPTPKGGGSAIVHALTAGLPALSTNQGDAYEAVRTFPVIEDFAVLARVAADLAQRGKTFEAYVRMAKARAPTLNSKAPVVEKLLAAYETFARRPRG